jgi:hypothetical protein
VASLTVSSDGMVRRLNESGLGVCTVSRTTENSMLLHPGFVLMYTLIAARLSLSCLVSNFCQATVISCVRSGELRCKDIARSASGPIRGKAVAALRITFGKVIVLGRCLDILDGVNWDWDPMCSNMSRLVGMLEALRRGKPHTLSHPCLMSRAAT